MGGRHSTTEQNPSWPKLLVIQRKTGGVKFRAARVNTSDPMASTIQTASVTVLKDRSPRSSCGRVGPVCVSSLD